MYKSIALSLTISGGEVSVRPRRAEAYTSLVLLDLFTL